MSRGPLSADVVAVYKAALLSRIRGFACPSCGTAFNLGSVKLAQDGTSLDEYRLTDESVARVFAATQHFELACGRCGTHVAVGEPVLRVPERRAPPAGELQPLASEAARVYRSRLRERTRKAACQACGRSLESAEVLWVAGGTGMDDYELSDLAVAELLAVNQCLCVRCGECGAETRV
jgi:hypothetical protein